MNTRVPLLLILLWAPLAKAQEFTRLADLLAAFQWNLKTTEITSEKLDDGLHVLFGAGGNIAVSLGKDGVLIVDDQFPELIPKINKAIKKLGGGKVDYAINTHWHFDHAEGNLALGPDGTILIAHSNSREMMRTGGLVNLVVAKYRQAPYPAAALPVIAYEKRMELHYNGGHIDLFHGGPAHTAGDTAIFFRKHNAVHMGDVFNNAGFPFIDVDSGGGIDGMIAFCEAVSAQLAEDAIVIPGHGPVTDKAALEDYIYMLKTVRLRVQRMIDTGKTLAEVEAANPAAEFEERYGPVANSLGFLNRVYASLSL